MGLMVKGQIVYDSIWEWGRLHISEGVIFRKWESNNGQKCWDQLILPMKYSLLEQLYDSVIGRHLRFYKTLVKIQARFFWPKMREDIKLWVQNLRGMSGKEGFILYSKG